MDDQQQVAAKDRSTREEANLEWLRGFLHGHKASEHQSGAGRKMRSDCQKGMRGAPEVLSPFLERVFVMVGMAFGGLWNSPIQWDCVRWNGASMVTLPIAEELSTFDNSALLSLVAQAARYGIRMVIRTRYLKLEVQFSAMGGFDGMGRTHPGMADMTTVLADASMTCGSCRYFEYLFGGDETEVETTGSCQFPRGALPLSMTRNSMSLANSSCPEASWTGCGCWTAKGDMFDRKKDNDAQ